MNKKTVSALILVSSVVISGVIVGSAMAQTSAGQSATAPSATIAYPIPELGNCQSQEDCRTFCNDTKNADACLAFAQAHNLMSADEVAAAKKFQDAGMVGPGGCKGKDACDSYCSVKDHMETCIAFAEKSGLMSEQKLQESQKVLAAIKKGVKPLGCNSEQECDRYCATAEHMEECINFGTAAGILPARDQENARKVLTAIKNGAVPPCHGEECPAFCGKREHAAACEQFRVEAGIPSRSEMIVIQAILTLIGKGTTMSTCSGAQGCQDYCSQNAHVEECVKFAQENGAITSSQAQAAQKGGEAAPQGPGGCKTKEECDAFCNNSDNAETCFNYAKDNGLISDEDLKKVENSQQQMKDSFNNMPAEISSCLTTSLGADAVEKLKSGNAMPSQKTAEQMKTCFDQYTPTAPTAPSGPGGQAGQNQGGQGQGGGKNKGGNGQGQGNQPTPPMPPNQPTQPTPPGQSGQNQPMKNRNGQAPSNQQGQQTFSQAGPGGCATPEACKAYCQSHAEAKAECQQFKQSQKQGQPGQNQPMQGQNNQQPSQPTPPSPPSQPAPPSQPNPPSPPQQPTPPQPPAPEQ